MADDIVSQGETTSKVDDGATAAPTPTPSPSVEAQGAGAKTPSTEELVNALRYMFKEVQTLKSSLDSVQGNITNMATPPEKQQLKSPEPRSEAFNDIDVEMLDNKGLVNYIDNRLQEQLRPVTEGIQSLNNTSARSEGEGQVTKLRGDSTAHFDAFVNEVRDIMESKGGAISVEEALILAKAQDPDKVARLNEESAPAKEPESPFVGLLPTSGQSSRNNRMDGKEAASAAWEELGLDDVVRELSN